MLTEVASAVQQARRRLQVQRQHQAMVAGLFDEAGRYRSDNHGDWRCRMWHATSLLAGAPEYVRLGNRLLASSVTAGGGHFWSSVAASVLRRYEAVLEPEMAQGMRQRLAVLLPAEARQRYRGYNDNFPSMAAAAAILGGELLNQPTMVEGGLHNLRSACDLLTRRGFMTEYASPTYSAITLTCLAEIAELAQDAEARRMALAVEQRIWVELAARFHRPTASLAGPHSRAYMVDMVAHPHNVHALMYLALGEAVALNPTNSIFPAPAGQALHNGAEHGWAHVAWHVMPTYHVPAEAVELALRKPAVCVVEADTEQAAFQRNVWSDQRHARTPLAEFAAGEAHLYTYFHEPYALGTSSRPCMDGYQHTAFHLVYPRHTPLRDATDIAAMFSRYQIGHRQPDRHHHLIEQGRTLGVQHEGAAMVLAWPKPAWGQDTRNSGEDPEVQPVDSLKLSLFLTCFAEQPKEIWLGDHRVTAWDGQAPEACPIFIHDGPIFLAIHPLLGTNLGRDVAVRLRRVAGFGVIELVNYAGPPRLFEMHELLLCRNGFVLETAADGADFAEFRQRLRTPKITDEHHLADAMRLVRYQRPGLELALEVSPVSEGVKCRTVNGRQVRAPKLRLPGVDVSSLPLM